MLLLPMALPVWLKVMAIWVVASATSLAAYHWLIRPWPLLRWSMGMSGAAPSTPAIPQPTAAPPGVIEPRA
jgi:hypothetical protein